MKLILELYHYTYAFANKKSPNWSELRDLKIVKSFNKTIKLF